MKVLNFTSGTTGTSASAQLQLKAGRYWLQVSLLDDVTPIDGEVIVSHPVMGVLASLTSSGSVSFETAAGLLSFQGSVSEPGDLSVDLLPLFESSGL